MNSDKTESKIMNNNKQQNIQKGNSLKKKGIYKIIFLSTIIIIVIIIIAFYFISLNGYKALIKKYCSGVNDLDINSIKDLFPKDLVDRSKDFDDIETTIKYYKDIVEENNMDFSVECNIGKAKRLSSKSIKEYVNKIDNSYKINLKVDKIYEFETKIKMRTQNNDDINTSEQSQKFLVGKINNNWYLLVE